MKKLRTVKVKKSEILNTQGQGHSFGQRQLQVCQNPDLLWGVPVVAGSKTQEERDGGRLPAGGEMPVIADGDREHGREVWALSAGREVPTAVA